MTLIMHKETADEAIEFIDSIQMNDEPSQQELFRASAILTALVESAFAQQNKTDPAIEENTAFGIMLSTMAEAIHAGNIERGFWPSGATPEALERALLLIHSEISECVEAIRKDNPPDKHLPEFDNATVELADAVIRILDVSAAYNLNLGEAIVKKVAFNESRPYKHGKTF